MKGCWKGLYFAMGQDDSSAAPDYGLFDRTRAQKRGGRAELIRLDWQDAEARLGLEPEERLTPETLYDAQWALLLVRGATGA